MQEIDQEDRILGIVSSLYRFDIIEREEDRLILEVHDFSGYSEDDFVILIKRLSSLGYVAFTGPEGSNKIYIMKKGKRSRHSALLKFALLLVTLGSIIYTGYSYDVTYSVGLPVLAVLSNVMLFFLTPLAFIMISREAGRYLAHRLNGMTYSLPILVPDPLPLGMGVLGSIGSQDEPYPSRRAMFQGGMFPLIAGFLSSLLVIVVGSQFHIGGNSLVAPVNSSFRSVSLPLTYSLLFSKITPVSVTLNLVQYAGWIGIVINALNAFPIGFLDGGLISKALAGNLSKYISYAAVVAFFGTSLYYPSWLIILVFVLFIGLKGPEPMMTVSKLSNSARILTGIVLFIFLVSIVPTPYHVLPNDIQMRAQSEDALVLNGLSSSAYFNVTIYNLGSTPITPSFTISPSVPISVLGPGGSISPRGDQTYTVKVPLSQGEKAGTYNYTLNVYSGISKCSVPLTIFVVNVATEMSFNSQIPLSMSMDANSSATLKFTYYAPPGGEQYFRLLSFAPSCFSYSIIFGNITFLENGFWGSFSNGFMINPGQVLSITIEPHSATGIWIIALVDTSYTAAVAYVSVGNGGS